MDQETWQQIADVFSAALERPAAERAAFLDEACASRADIRHEVESLLAAHEEDDPAKLSSPAHALAPDLVADLADDPQKPAATPLTGLRLGPYELHEVIGHGGMAEVYRASRADQQYHREVAVKLVRPGVRVEQIDQRFRVERQILAQLDHPNIATLLDGGVTDDGRPYLVMPYVKGRPITEHADARKASVADRLKLMRTVCDAVQFAHANLVVHRDLKPSNILVTDTEEVRLLDFGIAKLLDPGSIEVTMAVTEDARLLTPDYAAPEQLQGEAITTATDVHALGVLLYELLTGSRPYRGNTLMELQRSVCTQEAARPSTVATQPMSDDLDAIVLMALRKEPHRRYASAGQLGDDIGRVLAGQPVVARPDTVGYRLRKFLGRNRLAVGAATVVALLLLAATLFSLRQSQQRAVALEVAEDERDKARQLSEFLIDVFRESEPGVGEDVTARQLLDAGARRIRSFPDARPTVRAEMSQAIGESYRALGLYDQADSMLARALALRLDHPDRLGLARSYWALGGLRILQGRYGPADALLDSALALYEAEGGSDPNLMAFMLEDYATALADQARLEEAREYLTRALDLRTESFGEDHPSLVNTWSGFGRLAALESRHEEALAHLRRALAVWPDSLGADHPDYLEVLENLALGLENTGEIDAAIDHHRQILAGREVVFGPDHPNVSYSLHNLGRALAANGDHAVAIPYYERAIAIREKALGPDHPAVAYAVESLAIATAVTGDPAGAESLFLRASSILESALGPRHPETLEVLANLAYLYNLLGRTDDALTRLEIAVDRGWRYLSELQDGRFAALEGHPRFDALMERLEAEEPSED